MTKELTPDNCFRVYRAHRNPEHLMDFVQVFDDVLSPTLCTDMLQEFKNNPSFHERHDGEAVHFTQMNMSAHGNGNLNRQFMTGVRTAFIEYQKAIGQTLLRKMIPANFAMEEIRLKRYEVGSVDDTNHDRFDAHVDVFDYPTARRMLILMFYLEDVEVGGETCFLASDTPNAEDHLERWQGHVKPKQGRALLFPPTWQYLHAALAPKSGPKSIIGTYWHYV